MVIPPFTYTNNEKVKLSDENMNKWNHTRTKWVNNVLKSNFIRVVLLFGKSVENLYLFSQKQGTFKNSPGSTYSKYYWEVWMSRYLLVNNECYIP